MYKYWYWNRKHKFLNQYLNLYLSNNTCTCVVYEVPCTVRETCMCMYCTTCKPNCQCNSMFYAPVGNNTDDTLSPTGSAALSVPSSLLVVQHMTPFLTPPSASTPVTNGIM